MDREIYLDNNATTRPLKEVCDAMLFTVSEGFGNPSSANLAGQRARDALWSARVSLAALLGVDPDTLIFTSGATEANNTVIFSAAASKRGASVRFVSTTVEHPSILNMLARYESAGAEVVLLPVNGDGRLDIDRLELALTRATNLVSVQCANSETGVIQPITEIGSLCRQKGIPFHTDAAQAIGKLSMEVAQLPVDFLSLSSHKFHGPTGTGSLYIRHELTAPILCGGAQEDGRRAGTENLPGIVGLGAASAIRRSRFVEVEQRLRMLRDLFERLIRETVPDVSVNGAAADRVCNTTNLQFAGVDGQALVARLDQRGIRCSQSTACTNRHPAPSAVLRAMGLSEAEAYESVRFSVGEWNTVEEINDAAGHVAEICDELRRFRIRYHNPNLRLQEVH